MALVLIDCLYGLVEVILKSVGLDLIDATSTFGLDVGGIRILNEHNKMVKL